MPQLANRTVCTGCGSCYNTCQHGALEMREDNEGFFFPEVKIDLCVECGLCSRSCPELQELKTPNETPPKTFALINSQDAMVSSSGGAFSSISRYVLGLGGVVFGATLNQDGTCCHQYTDTVYGLAPMRGSKYIQSNIGQAYKEIKKFLEDGRWVLFTGTPCQVAGLKSYLKKPQVKLIAVDLVCHGVPSNKIFNAYIQKLSNKRPSFAEIEGYEFRKLNGWGILPSVKLSGKFRPLYGVDNLYMEAFVKCAIFRQSCYQCRYARIPRQGDLTIADFWGIGKHGVAFRQETSKGVSLVLINNDKGKDILSSIAGSIIEERTYEEAMIENPNLYSASHYYENRNKLIASFLDKSKTLDEIEQEFHLVDNSIKGKVKRLAIKIGVFNVLKFVYNLLKAL